MSVPPVDAACPLCGAPLDPAQEWCLSCGAAARTRLAAPTNWKAPIATIAAIAVLALGVLAAALVKLSGGPGKTTTVAPVTTTITATTPIVATPTTTTGISIPGTPTTIAPGGSTSPGGAVAPGTPTTLTPTTGTTGTATIPTTTATTPTATSPGATEEELRKAGFPPRTKK